MTADGRTLAVETLHASRIKPFAGPQILHARRLAEAYVGRVSSRVVASLACGVESQTMDALEVAGIEAKDTQIEFESGRCDDQVEVGYEVTLAA